jgi:hypothetical protein
MHFDHDDPEVIWIDPQSAPGGRGSHELPYSMIEEGLARIQPGQSMVLRAGIYSGDCNIQTSGSARRPIRIAADENAKVVVKEACWYFYDTSDLIVSGITFADAPHGAISVVGACSRNRFEHLRFINCGTKKETACTLYLGGAGGECNVVAHCSFEHAPHPEGEKVTTANASVGLMIAQGNADRDALIVNNLIRRNRFVNYGYGILAGGEEVLSLRCGHIIEYNTFQNCMHEALVIRSGDTQVRGNKIEQCGGCAIAVKSELECIIENNRIADAGCGIHISGEGHTVAGNCMIRCGSGAVHVGVQEEECGGPVKNCFIENNTFIDCTTSFPDTDEKVAGVVIDAGSTGLMQRNLMYGTGKPYVIMHAQNILSEESDEAAATRFIIKDNGAAGGCSLTRGVGNVTVIFTDGDAGNYENGSGFGADGWVLTPQGFDPDADTAEEAQDYREASVLEDENGTIIIPGEENDEGVFERFFNAQNGDGDDHE